MLLPETGSLGTQKIKPVQYSETDALEKAIDPEQLLFQLQVIQIMGLTSQFVELPGGRLKKRPDFKLGQGHNSDKKEHRKAIVSNLQFRQAAAKEDFRQQIEDHFNGDLNEVSLTDPVQETESKPIGRMTVYNSHGGMEKGLPRGAKIS
ncbi:MAG TPA: hypothetical protein VJ242_03090 [Patescibacteria group bacterium]|nr:MAG: hypothetical protein A3J17_05380 [Candidatus Curtissbacteria bacterium RIFCSPLOWO2_02_FULL_40_11]HKZ35678.1 hypothetical protein [Patescibacteria group bacterium]